MRKDLYKVPDIKLKELIEYFNEIQINIQSDEILKPTPHTAYNLFSMIVEAFQGESILESLSKVEHGHENSETLKILILYKRMSLFMKRIGIYNFSILNICQPDCKKLISVLSVIMNFSIFRDNKRELYERVMTAVHEREKLKSELQERMRNTKSEIEKTQKKIEENEKQRKTEENEIEETETILKEKLRELRMLATEIEKIKHQKSHIFDVLSENKLKIVNFKQNILNYESQILSNPEELIDELRKLRESIEKENYMIEKLKDDGRKKTEITHGLVNFINKIKSVNINAAMLKQTMSNIEEYTNKNEILDNKINEAKQEIKSLQLKADHLGRQILHLESKIFNIQNLSEIESEKIAAELEQIKEKYEKISNERDTSNNILSDNINKCKKLETRNYYLKKVHEESIMKLLNELKELKCKVKYYTCSGKPLN